MLCLLSQCVHTYLGTDFFSHRAGFYRAYLSGVSERKGGTFKPVPISMLESNTTKLNRDSVLADFLIQPAGCLEVGMDGQAIFG